MIPHSATAVFNIRFNDEHKSGALIDWIKTVCTQFSENYNLDVKVSGESFFSEPGKLCNIVKETIKEEIGSEPILSTNGGTSDGRFIKDYSSVVEFGLIGKTMHKFNEKIDINDIYALSKVYLTIISKYFQNQ